MGYSLAELDTIQARWELRFPPDLIELLRQQRPLLDGPSAFDWIDSDPDIIRDRLAWPFESFWYKVQDEHHSVWWPEWGDKPAGAAAQHSRLKQVFAAAPKLIPLCGHRYLPAEPFAPGNPVFSVFYTDVICYGTDLADWMERERGGYTIKPWTPIKEIAFWSEAVRKNSAG